MDNDKRRVLIGQVWEYSKLLSIISGVVLSAFTFSGYIFMTSDILTYDNHNPLEKSNTSLTVNQQLPLVLHTDNQIGKAHVHTVINKTTNIGAGIQGEIVATENKPAIEKIHALEDKSGKLPSTKNTLANFSAECNDNNVSVSWITEGDGNESYKLESSIDSKHFESILSSPVVTNNEKSNHFQVTIPVADEGNRFFRLKKKINDNKFEYSEILEANCSQNKITEIDIDVFPAGYGAYKVVVFSKVEDHLKIVMTDLNEIELVSDEFEVEVGHNEYIFKSGIMPRGNYNLKVTNGTTISQRKVAIK